MSKITDLDLEAKRLKGESFEDYKARRKESVRKIKDYLKKGELIWKSASLTPIISDAGLVTSWEYRLKQGVFKGNLRRTFGF